MVRNVKLSIATAGAALFALGTVGAVPAKAGTLTFDYQAEVSGSVKLDPDGFLADQGLPIGTIPPLDFSQAFAGSFTTLDDPAQFMDGDITLDTSFLSSVLGFPIADLSGSPLDDILSIDFKGSGTLNSNKGSTLFNFNYVSAQKAIVIDGFDTNVVSGCPIGLCNADGTGQLDVLVNLGFFLNTFSEGTDSFSYEAVIPPTFVRLANAETNFKVATIPQSVPEPTALIGLIGFGGFFAAKRKLQKAA